MDTQSIGDLEKEVLTMATEDMYGRYEIVWTLNVSHPDVPKDEKVAVGRAVIRGRHLVTLHRLEWNPPREMGVIPPDERAAGMLLQVGSTMTLGPFAWIATCAINPNY